MAIALTPNAIGLISTSTGDESQREEFKPIVQISDLRAMNTGQQPNERFRLILSDGVHSQQGMLATQQNNLVHSGKLQKGSVVQLTQFVCNTIQNRKIIIIIELNVIIEKYEIIGDPKTFAESGATGGGPIPQSRPSMPRHSSLDKPGNPQTHVTASLPGQNLNVRAPAHHSTVEPGLSTQRYGSSFSSNPGSGGYGTSSGAPVYPKAEPGARLPGSTPLSGSYGNQNPGFQNPRAEGGMGAPSNAYSRSLQPTYQHAPPMYGNRGPLAKNEAPARIIPIAALNPYQGRWTIKARVTFKKDLRRWNNARGEGQVFSFELLDSDGGEIQVTCFNAVADQFYHQIEIGKVYLISRGTLKPASKSFNRCQNEYEIQLDITSTIQPCLEDDSTIPKQQFNFRPISEIERMEVNSFVDIIGVVLSINLTANILKKDGTETLKRTLQMKDMSDRSVELTLWGNLCNTEGQKLQNLCDAGTFPVLAVKACRVGEFNGRSLSTTFASLLLIDPDIPEARRLKEWFDMEGKSTPSVSITKEFSGTGKQDARKTVSQIKDERLGTSEKPDFITVAGTITFIKLDNFCYTACPLMVGDRPCLKKVINNGDGQWRCDRCDRSVAECDYRYNMNFQIQDHTGMTYATAFNESSEQIMNISAKELYLLKTVEQDDDKFMDIIRRVLFTRYIVKLKVKEESYSDELRVKSTIVKVEKLNFSSEAKYLLDIMDKLSVEGPNAVIGQAGSTIDSRMSVGYQSAGNVDASPYSFISPGSSIAGRTIGAPANQVGQYGNHYGGLKEPATMGIGANLYCNSCGSTSHSTNNCPSVTRQPVQPMGVEFMNRGPASGGPSGECFKCHKYGHFARDCPSSYNAGSGGGGSNGGGGSTGDGCYKCKQPGHWAKDCPGSSTVSSGYGSSGVTGRYGGVSNQRVGGF